MKLLLFIVLLITVFPIIAYAQRPLDVCRVYSYWTSTKSEPSGSIFVLGEIRPTTFEDEIIKSFVYGDTGFTASASVDYYLSDDKPKEIVISLAVSEKGQSTFKTTDYVVAKTNYGKKWGELSVEKEVIDGDMIYTFVVECNDGKRRK
jgi:hypothetical protein